MCTCNVSACLYNTRQIVGGEFMVVLIVPLLWYLLLKNNKTPNIYNMCEVCHQMAPVL